MQLLSIKKKKFETSLIFKRNVTQNIPHRKFSKHKKEYHEQKKKEKNVLSRFFLLGCVLFIASQNAVLNL